MLIPASNLKNLILRADVVAAVADGKFHVHAVGTVDEAIELMTGVRAGERSLLGDYRADSINGRVAARLAEFSAIRRAFAGGPAGARKRPGAGRRALRSP